MPYTLLTTQTQRLFLPRFPETLAEARDVARQYVVPTVAGGDLSISKWLEAQWVQPDGELVDSDLDLAAWRFGPSSGGLQLLAFETCEEAPGALTCRDVMTASQMFLDRPQTRAIGAVLFECAEDTYYTVFEARIRLGVASICAPRHHHPRLKRFAAKAGYMLRK